MDRSIHLSSVLGAAWDTFTANWKNVALTLVAIVLPYMLITYLLPMWLLSDLGSATSLEAAMTSGMIMLFVYALIVALIALAIFPAVTAMFILMVKDESEGKQADSFGNYLKRGFKLWPQFVLLGIILGLAQLGLLILLVIPAIIFGVYWTFAFYSFVMRGKKTTEAMKHSKELVKGRWWKTLGYLILLAIFQIVIDLPSTLFAALGANTDYAANYALDSSSSMTFAPNFPMDVASISAMTVSGLWEFAVSMFMMMVMGYLFLQYEKTASKKAA